MKCKVCGIENGTRSVCESCGAKLEEFVLEDGIRKNHLRKLVRDKMPLVYKHQLKKFDGHKVEDPKQLRMLIMENIQEEIDKLKKGESEVFAMVEIIDLVLALGGTSKLAFEDIFQKRKETIDKYGSFANSCYIKWVEEK